MSVTIDSLELEILDNSEAVIAGLEKLKATLSGFKTLTSTTGFAKMSKQLGELSAAVNKMPGTQKMKEFAEGLSTMAAVPKANISKSLANQITAIGSAAASLDAAAMSNLRDLKNALQPLTELGKPQLGSFVTQLKKLPEVATAFKNINMDAFAASIQRVTVAIRPLADEMAKVGAGFSALPSKIQRIIKSNENLSTANLKAGKTFGVMGTGISSLQAKFGIYYAMFSRAANVMGGWVTKSNEYVENLNLFTVSMGQYAGEALKYAEQVQSAMGIDMSEWIRTQGIFMQLGTGFGVAKDKAYQMSKALTQISYDLSSYFNIDIASAQDKVKSGFAGELEPLRNLGYALDQATLQQVAYKNGIQQSVNAMTQAQKSQLRYIAIMEQSRNVMGDMGRTLMTPANAMRILGQQTTQLTRALGNMLIPILMQIVPYVQAVVVVLTEAAQAIANLFGFTIPTIDYSGLDGLASGTGDVTAGLEEATSAAKELNGSLAFDELNIISKNNAPAGGGVGGGGDLGLDMGKFDYDFLGEANTKLKEITNTIKSFFAAFKKNPVVKLFADTLKFMWEKAIKPLGEWIIKNPNKVVDFFTALGVAIVTYKLTISIANIAKALHGATGLISGLSALSSMGGAPKVLTGLVAVLTNPWALAIAAVAGAITLVGISVYQAGEDAKRADLEGRFGDIALSMDEVKSVAKSLTTSDFTLKMNAYFDEKSTLDNMYNSLSSISDELKTETWKLSLGVSVDLEAYKVNIDSFIKQTQDTLAQQNLVYQMAIELGFSNSNVQVEMKSFADKFYLESQVELDRLGKQLRQSIDDGLADGVLSGAELETITKLQSEMNEIVSRMADAEFKAQLRSVILDVSGTDLTPESFQSVLAEGNRILSEQFSQLDAIRIDALQIAELKFAEDGNKSAYDEAVRDVQNTFKANKFDLQMQVNSFGLDTIFKAYQAELTKEIPNFSDFMVDSVGDAMQYSWDYMGEEKTFNLSRFIFGIQDSMSKDFESTLTPAMQANVSSLLVSMQPQIDEMQLLRDSYIVAGQAIPESLSSALTDIATLQALAGNTSALYELIGSTLSNSPEQVALFEQLKSAGYNIPQEIINGMHTQNENVATNFSNLGAMAGGSLSSGFIGQYEPIQSALDTTIQNAMPTQERINELIFPVGGFIGQGMKLGLENSAQLPTNAITQVLADMLTATHDGAWQFGSPSQTAMDFGFWIVEGLQGGIVNNALLAINAVGKLTTDMIDRMKLQLGMKENVSLIFRGIGNTVTTSLMLGIEDNRSALNALLEAVSSEVRTAMESIVSDVRSNVDDIVREAERAREAIEELQSMSVEVGISTKGIKGYSTGGYPESGELFYAHENGIPEFVGTTGNRAVVANNNNLESGIAAGNAEQNALLYEQNNLLRELLAKNTTIEIDGNEVGRSVDRYNSNKGYSVGGAFANLY